VTALEIYNGSVKQLTADERIRLAALILNDIAGSPVDISDEWTDQDLRDVTNWSLRRLDEELGDAENA